MTEQPKETRKPAQSEQPQQSEQPATGGRAQSGAGEVFGDGSTSQQREEHIRAAEETNAAVKKLADTEREARGG